MYVVLIHPILLDLKSVCVVMLGKALPVHTLVMYRSSGGFSCKLS